MKIHGFTLLRNGLKYDYPFRESLLSLLALCEHVTLALGRSEDGTEAAVDALPGRERLTVIPTVWDEGLREGGRILSQQTNVALEAARAHCQSEGAGPVWGVYLQADEVLGEFDFDRIRADLAEATRAGRDAVRFRYLHFWGDYQSIAIARRWYAHEVRAVRLDLRDSGGGGARSYGDAQSFEGFQAAHESDAHVFHYGHVREAAAYALKKRDFHRWWHPDGAIAAVLARGERGDARQECVRYLGPHPQWMRERITGGAAASVAPRAPGAWTRLRHALGFPRGMRARGARPWTPEFRRWIVR